MSTDSQTLECAIQHTVGWSQARVNWDSCDRKGI